MVVHCAATCPLLGYFAEYLNKNNDRFIYMEGTVYQNSSYFFYFVIEHLFILENFQLQRWFSLLSPVVQFALSVNKRLRRLV